MRRIALIAAVAVLFLPGAASAAQITLRDGSVMYGRMVSATSNTVVFEQSNGMRRSLRTDDINLINFTMNGPARDGADRMMEPPPPGNPAAMWITLPAGTEIAVRTGETIRSENVSPGPYVATIAADVLDPSGNVIIPRGSDAELVVRGVDDSSGLGSRALMLDLNAIRVNGRRRMVDTTDLRASDHSGIGANKRTGEMVGGGAVVGTLLGAIAGGGKGAAIGALAGAAAGGGAQVLTRGKEIRVPAESVLTFRLEQPMRLREVNN
jgi:hypothetical protein